MIEQSDSFFIEDLQMPVLSNYVFSEVIQFLQRKIPNLFFEVNTPAFVKRTYRSKQRGGEQSSYSTFRFSFISNIFSSEPHSSSSDPSIHKFRVSLLCSF